jgi:hypothetical protein
MDKYFAAGTQTVANPLDTTIVLAGVATRRGKIYEVIMSHVSAPADITLKHTIQRFSAPGTASAVTPAKLDKASPAALCVCGDNSTVEPTYTAGNVVLQVGVNQRATFRWVAAPGAEIVLPATADDGVGEGAIDVAAAATPEVMTTLYWEE